MNTKKKLAALAASGALLVTLFVVTRAFANNSGAGTGTYLAQTTVQTGDTFANSTTPTSFTSGAVIAAGQLSVGRTVMAVFGGTLSAISTVTPTCDVAVVDSSGTGTPILWRTGTTLNIGAVTNLTWEVRCYITCVTAGASGAVRVTGGGYLGQVIATVPITGQTAIAGTGTIAWDTTIAHTLVAQTTWSYASASLTISQGYCFPFLGN